MARRKEAAQDSLFAEFEGEADDLFDQPQSDDADSRRGSGKDKRKRRGPRPGGGVVGAPETALLPAPDRVNLFSVIFKTLVALIAFLIIGFAVVFVLQLTNTGGAEAGAEATEEAIAPSDAAGTPVASMTGGEEAAPTAAPTDGPTPTPDPGCTLGLGWWFEIQDEWTFFAGSARTEWLTPLDAAQYDATIAALQARRQDVERVFTPPCYLPAQAQLLAGADGMIAAVELLKTGDAAGGRSAADSAASQLALVLTQLWDQATFTSPDSPPTAGIPRGGGDVCQPADWYAQAGPNLSALLTALTDYAANAGSVLTQQLQIGNLDAAIGNFAVLNPSGCAATMQTIAVNAFSAAADGLRLFTSGQTSEGRARISDFWSQKTIFDAWLTWLGLRVI